MLSTGKCRCELLVILLACGKPAPQPRPVTPYPIKEVSRQELVYHRAPESVLGNRPQPLVETRYYIFSRDGYACEVDFMQYLAVQPGDRVSCRWFRPGPAAESPP